MAAREVSSRNRSVATPTVGRSQVVVGGGTGSVRSADDTEVVPPKAERGEMGTSIGAGETMDEVDARANGEAVAPSMENPDETNVWPTASEEAAFLSEARGRGEVVVPIARETAEEVEENAKALPKLSELVERIPPETRELLVELFRARFVAVKRVRKADLKK